MLGRREFIAALSCSGTAAAAPPAYQPVLAAQAYVFSQAYAKLEQRMLDRVPEVFETIGSAGFQVVELTSDFFSPDLASGTANSLLLARLRCPVVYNGGFMHTADAGKQTIQMVVDIAKRVKGVHPFTAINFNANPKPKNEPKTDGELAIQAENITRLARELKKSNVRLMIHQHAPEMADGAREWRHILKNTDPKLVDICLDVHWVLRGGQDPMTLLKESGNRLASLHLRNSKKGVWLEEFADGDIDYSAVAKHLREINYTGQLVVELAWDKETDVTRSLEENLKRSREYAEKTFGVKASRT